MRLTLPFVVGLVLGNKYPAEKEIFMIYSMEEYIGNQQKLLNRIIGMNLKIPVFS